MTTKNVAFVGAICVTIGWLLASTVSPPVARVQSRPTRPAQPTAVVEEQFVEQLQLRLQRLPAAAPERRRNPFTFAARERVLTATPHDEAQRADTLPVSAAPTVPTPRFMLSGIGVSGDVRTAVLTTGQDVHIVKVADAIGGYTVLEITEASVTLARGDERHTLRFAQ